MLYQIARRVDEIAKSSARVEVDDLSHMQRINMLQQEADAVSERGLWR